MSESVHLFLFRIAQQIGHDVTKEFLAPHKVRLTLPGGFPYEAFDATGNVSRLDK